MFRAEIKELKIYLYFLLYLSTININRVTVTTFSVLFQNTKIALNFFFIFLIYRNPLYWDACIKT